jgi:hypothetical protein
VPECCWWIAPPDRLCRHNLNTIPFSLPELILSSVLGFGLGNAYALILRLDET